MSDDLDRRTIVIFVAALLSLWFAHFGLRYVPETSTRLAELCWWSGTQIVSYLIVPLIVVRLVGWKPSDIGWKFRGTSRHWNYYAILFVIAVPFVVVASTTTEFQNRYPLLEVFRGQEDVWPDLRIRRRVCRNLSRFADLRSSGGAILSGFILILDTSTTVVWE